MKKTVFISSTSQDLGEHRHALWQLLEEFDVAVRGMERFGARPESPIETCLAEVEQSDVYVGLVAFRLGTVHSASGKSFTQLEYEHAVRLDKVILIYLADEEAQLNIRVGDIDFEPTLREKLKAFKETLNERHTVATFTSPEDLTEKLRRDFSAYLAPLRAEPKARDEFDNTLDVIDGFLLRPKAYNGREVRLNLTFKSNPFPASREICKAFNLEFGMAIGIWIGVLGPTIGGGTGPPFNPMKRFRCLFATGKSVESLMALSADRNPQGIYAKVQFSERSIPQVEAEFFGQTHYEDPDEGDPLEHYVPAEGKIILLFTKAAPQTLTSIEPAEQ